MVNLPEGTTQNLMDYSAGTELFKYQWDFIHNPEGGWFLWEDVDEGAAFGNVNLQRFEVRRVIEKLRFAYAFDRSISFDNFRKTSAANGITMGDGINYNRITIALDKVQPFSINPRNCDKHEDFFVFLASDSLLRTGFCASRATNQRTFYSVEFEAHMRNQQYQKLKDYVFCANEQSWHTHLNTLLSNGGSTMLRNIEAYSNDAIAELSVAQKISLLQTISTTDTKLYFELALRVFSNFNPNQFHSFYQEFTNSNMLFDFRKNLSPSQYKVFIQELVWIFYALHQNEMNTYLSILEPEDIYTWVKNAPTTEIKYSIRYISPEEVTISGRLEDRRQNFPSYVATFYNFAPKTYSPFDLVAVSFDSDLDFMDVKNKTLLMPVFFFEWINTHHHQKEFFKNIERTAIVASLALGIGELVLARSIFQAIFRTVGIVKYSGDLLFLNNEVKTKVRNLDESDSFIEQFEEISKWFEYTVFSFKLFNKSVETFDAFQVSWRALKDAHPDIRDVIGDSNYDKIEEIIIEINNP